MGTRQIQLSNSESGRLRVDTDTPTPWGWRAANRGPETRDRWSRRSLRPAHVDTPREALVVFIGVYGSGNSSLPLGTCSWHASMPTAPLCHGTGYNAKTLEIKYRDKSIVDVPGMSLDTAWEFFAQVPTIRRRAPGAPSMSRMRRASASCGWGSAGDGAVGRRKAQRIWRASCTWQPGGSANKAVCESRFAGAAVVLCTLRPD